MNTNKEKKLFEEGDIVITNERFVIGNKQFQLYDIKFASFLCDDNWKGVLVSIIVGCISFAIGIWWFGIIAFIWAYFCWKNPHDSLLLSMQDESIETLLFKDRKFGKQIAVEINSVLKHIKNLEAEALHEEMDNLS